MLFRSVRYNGSVTGAIIQIVPDDYQFSASAYESEKQAAEEERESLLADGYKAIPYRQYLAQQSGEGEPVAASYIPAWRTVFEDEGTIQAMADALCATYDAGVPLVFADFYFSDSSTGRQVMLPLSRLPQDVQDQFQSYMLEDASVTVAERAAARTVW